MNRDRPHTLAMTGSPSWTAPVGVLAVLAIAAGFLLFLLTRKRPIEDES